MLPIFLATYGAVFIAEIVGDKLLYTTGVLATRYRTVPILLGMGLAFMAKMAAAVLVGKAISTLPPLLVAAITAVNFIGIALVLWRKPDRREARELKPQEETSALRAAMLTFAAIFFTEWGDVGQVTAAGMAAKFNVPLMVWAGAVAAMVTKGALAASIGASLRGWIQRKFEPRTIRYAAVGVLLVLALFSVIETLEGGETPSL